MSEEKIKEVFPDGCCFRDPSQVEIALALISILPSPDPACGYCKNCAFAIQCETSKCKK